MKSKLTPELQDKIIKYIKAGSYIKEACKAVGIGESTYYDWLKWGKEDKKPYSEFSELTKQAEATGELTILLEIRQQVKKDWHAGMEILGRKYPDRWGRKDYMQANISIKVTEIVITHVIEAINKVTDDEDLKRRLGEELLKINLN